MQHKQYGKVIIYAAPLNSTSVFPQDIFEKIAVNHPVRFEAVFGQLKSNNEFSRFTLRKMDKVNIELDLMSVG